ncbi:MAG: hypothetical protein JJU00_20100 [Opitutales bacterium]|nr:hypothetical protein [Opitutales bacterium]
MKYARIDRLSDPQRIRSIHEYPAPLTGPFKEENGQPVLVPYTEEPRPTGYDTESERIERVTTITAESASVTWAVIDLTQEELDARAEARRVAIENRPVDDLMKDRLRAQTTLPEIDAERAHLFVPVYRQWRPGMDVEDGEILAYGEHIILQALSTHTTEAWWKPDELPSVYNVIVGPLPGEPYPRWRQPAGAHDAINAGARRIHNGYIWLNTHGDGNVWEPGAQGIGPDIWEQLEPFTD